MHIVIAEMYYPEGHKQLNYSFIEQITSFSDVTFVDNGDYFPAEIASKYKVNRIPVRVLHVRRIELLKTLSHAINLMRIAWRLRNIHYDTLLLLSFHTLAFSWVRLLFRGKKIVAVHHYNIDRMMKYPHEICVFKRYMNQIKHIVLADYIREGLIKETGVQSTNVFVVNHPLSKEYQKQQIESSEREDIFISLGRSIDEKLVTELVRIDQAFSTKLKYKIRMRSQHIPYDGKNVQIFSGYLPREQYAQLLQRAKACIIGYPSTYRLRYSGVINDALANGLIAICSDIPLAREYAAQYPNNCIIFHSVDELYHLAGTFNRNFDYSEYNAFLSDRTNDRVREQLLHALE